MQSVFNEHIQEQFSAFNNNQIGVAISGGVDSVVLAYLLKQCNVAITLLHCNFQLRGEDSTGDQIFVKQLAKEWNIPFLTIDFDTKLYSQENKTSIQIAARELRYNWFTKMAAKHNLKAVVTAHHADDNLETILINLSRGTGLEGVTGIPKINGLFMRPLLLFSKEEILLFAKAENIKWREDISNSDTKYLRNKIRHHIIPEYKQIQPQLLQNVNKTIKFLEQSQALVATYVEEKKEVFLEEDLNTNGFKLKIEKLNKEAHLDIVLFETLKPYGFSAWADIKTLLLAQSGKKIQSATHTLLKDREYILLYKHTNAIEEQTYVINESDSVVLINEGKINLETNLDKENSGLNVNVDKSLLQFPLIVRKWRKGDYFYPAGMQGKKKLSKYFKDEKLSIPEKENIWLLCSNNEIVWVIGKRADRRFLVNKTTTNSINITYEISK